MSESRLAGNSFNRGTFCRPGVLPLRVLFDFEGPERQVAASGLAGEVFGTGVRASLEVSGTAGSQDETGLGCVALDEFLSGPVAQLVRAHA